MVPLGPWFGAPALFWPWAPFERGARLCADVLSTGLCDSGHWSVRVGQLIKSDRGHYIVESWWAGCVRVITTI